MKQLISFCLLILLLISCRKNTDRFGLPKATQEGKQTLGFLLDGQPWTPKGVRGTANLSIDYDPGFNKGIVGIVAYDFSRPMSDQFTIGIRDSLNFMNAPFTINLTKKSLLGASFTRDHCDLFSSLDDVDCSGSMTITKLDRTNGIISGKFNVTLSRRGCDTYKITEGRFDMKF